MIREIDMGLAHPVLELLLNRSAASYLTEQIRKLYMRLYPYMVYDFGHIGDINESLIQLDAKIDALAKLLSTHVHPVPPGAAVSSVAAVQLPALPPTVMANDIALGLVILPGVPQPTGEALPAVLPSRVGPPTEIIATPPLNPADITGTGIV